MARFDVFQTASPKDTPRELLGQVEIDEHGQLKLLRSAIFPTGVVQLVYAPAEFPSEDTYADAADKLAGADG